MDIDKPCSETDQDYDVKCEMALAPALNNLADRALELGWNEEAVAKALIKLSVANYNSQIGEFSVNKAIEAANFAEMKGSIH